MKSDDFFTQLITIIFGVIFIIVGIYQMAVVGLENYEDVLFINNAETCYAYVDRVDEYTTLDYIGRSYKHTQHYDAYVHYYAGDEYFKNIEIPGTTPRKKGDTIQIYYNPNNPSEFIIRSPLYEQQSDYGKGAFTLACGGVLLILGIFSKTRR